MAKHAGAAAAESAGRQHRTLNDTDDNAKKVSIGVLQGCLTDAVDLYNATRQAHWNVKGPHFGQFHTLFEGFYTQLAEGTDDLAERIVQLGGTAMGTTQALAQGTRLEPYPTDLYDGMRHARRCRSATRRWRRRCARASTRPTRRATPTRRTY